MRIPSIVAGTAALALLAGCGTGGGTAGTPTPAAPPSSTSAAPEIENPLDVTKAEADACATVTPAQLEAFGMPGVTGRVNNTPLGGGCLWSGRTTESRMSPGLSFLPEGTNLSTIVPNASAAYETFEKLPAIQGYPTYLALVADSRKDGYCSVIIGVSAAKVLAVSFQSSTGSPKFADPCAAVTEFADLALTTIKAGAE